jgi:hypothetical protein
MDIQSKYDKVAEAHVIELSEWVSTPAGAKAFNDACGYPGRTVESYCDEYSDRYAIAAYLAKDMKYHRADDMLDEYPKGSEKLFDR